MLLSPRGSRLPWESVALMSNSCPYLPTPGSSAGSPVSSTQTWVKQSSAVWVVYPLTSSANKQLQASPTLSSIFNCERASQFLLLRRKIVWQVI